jgi:hypothetical protein
MASIARRFGQGKLNATQPQDAVGMALAEEAHQCNRRSIYVWFTSAKEECGKF